MAPATPLNAGLLEGCTFAGNGVLLAGPRRWDKTQIFRMQMMLQHLKRNLSEVVTVHDCAHKRHVAHRSLFALRVAWFATRGHREGGARRGGVAQIAVGNRVWSGRLSRRYRS